MKKVMLTGLTIISTVLVFGISCKIVEDNEDSSQGVKALRLASSDITPWTEVTTDGFKPFNASNMFDLVNGGAPAYIDKGVVNGFEQNMDNNSKSTKVRIWIIDFGTDANATAMYAKIDAENGDKVSADKWGIATAELDNSPLSGVNAYAHFGKYYVELAFTGYSDKSEAKTTAVSFLEVFEAKISSLK